MPIKKFTAETQRTQRKCTRDFATDEEDEHR
jgi:hypothetical protein